MGSRSKVSIVTPSYNQAEYLGRTIDSIASQDYPFVEHVVVDGGSTDDSVQILHSRDSDLTWWVSEADRGQADAINKGFAHTSGDICAWLNSDDTYLPGTISRVIQAFETHPDVDVVYGDLIVVDAYDAYIDQWKVARFDLAGYVYLDRGVLQPAAFWRRSAFEAVGGVNDSLHFAMDLDLFMRMALAGFRFLHIKEPLAAFRNTGTNKSCVMADVGRVERREVLKRLVDVEVDTPQFRWRRRWERARLFVRFCCQGDVAYAIRRATRPVPRPDH